jgi:AcrR family transcriptional regulator
LVNPNDNRIIIRDQGGGRRAADRVLATVTSMLETGGTDAVELAKVARQARVSMTTIYKYFGSRDELIVAAIEAWMDLHIYRPVARSPKGASVLDAMLRQFRQLLKPWEQTPRVAEAFMRAQFGPGGERLRAQGFAAVEPVTRSLFHDIDPDYAEDAMMIITNVMFSLLFRFAAGEIAVTEIRPAMERTLRRLLGDIERYSKVSPKTQRPATRTQAKKSG